ncbi:magnesium transporter [Natronococcus occultus]|uniref:Mg/Co/Ni transporter MgtE with CBS domain n=1 Tax=Natronococcus occultus SP4 TaxID=694430 RepID=L0JXT9_9EURY|nr:magnesium transporter [Natronococcus occultus]AGB36919.1 Mg/Co/Ni transporter MgtE with CBS domain [Natronococcus occultus SP4]
MTAKTPADEFENETEESTANEDAELRPDGGVTDTGTKTTGGGIAIRGENIKDAELTRSELILTSSLPKKIWLRLPWLLVALAGGLLAGGVIGGAEGSLEAAEIALLAIFVPVIMDMGGNVGTQASTIFVRGLATGHIDDKNAVKHLAREGVFGLVIGLIIGGIAATIALVWQGNAALSMVLFTALVAVCTIASVFGYLIPWVAHKLGFDPAAVSDPVVTTFKDLTAVLIYFGLAIWLLPGAL